MIKMNLQFFGGRGGGSGKGGKKGGGGGSTKVGASRVEVDSDRWQYSNGKRPSGYGNWAFKIGKETKFFSGKYSDAKKQAQKYAAEKGITKISVES